jgi:hypothetical protein
MAALGATALALAIPAAASAADDAAAGSLCDTISVEALAELGPLSYRPPDSGAPVYCLYEAAGDGGHRLSLAISGMSFELFQGPDIEVYDVGGHSAVVYEDSLLVDLGDDVLAVTPELADSPEAEGLDRLAYALDVAAVVVPALGAEPPEAAPAAAVVEPPTVDGVEWGPVDTSAVAELMASDQSQAEQWQPLVDLLGVDPSAITVINTNARDATADAALGAYTRLVIEGVEDERIRSSVQAWLLSVGGDGFSMEDRQIAGRDVAAVLNGGELSGFLYVADGTAHAIPGPEDVAARILEALP